MTIETDLELVHKYPWLSSLKVYSSEFSEKSPIEFIDEVFSGTDKEELKSRIISVFESSFDNFETIVGYKFDELNIKLYLLIKILLYVINDNRIVNRVANLYSKINYDKLIGENDYNVYSICEDMELQIEYSENPWIYGEYFYKDQKETSSTNFRVFFKDYLKLIANLRDDYRRLVNNSLKEGFVYISKKSLLRLIQEFIRNKIIGEKKTDPKQAEMLRNALLKNNDFREIYDKIVTTWNSKKEEFGQFNQIDYAAKDSDFQLFPPCMKEILKKAADGVNLPHIERLVILFFLHALNVPEQKITDIFSTMPDFDRDKTEYQVRFAKEKGYTPHSCETLKTYELCMAEKYKEDLCLNGYYSKKLEEQRKISHPLFYFQFQSYQKSKGRKTLSEKK